MTLQTKNRIYLKPATQVFELQQQELMQVVSDRKNYEVISDNPFGGNSGSRGFFEDFDDDDLFE